MKEFIKKRYNILIPAALLLVILIALLLYGREYKINRYVKETDTKVYQYFSGIKMEYELGIGRNRKEVILNLAPKDFTINLDSTPIYIEDKESVIFPKEMSMVFPLSNKEYKVDALSEVYKKNNLYYLNIKNINDSYNHFFLYDGKDLYFFIDEVTIEVGDTKITLSPLSYLSCNYGNLLEYYNKEDDTYGKIDLTNETVTVSTDYFNLDVTVDEVIYEKAFTKLSPTFGSLPKISEREVKTK